MGRTSLFLKLYRRKLPENFTLFLLFSIMAAAISMVLLVQKNNADFIQNQLAGTEFAGDAEGILFAYQSMENILGFIGIAAICVGAAGGACLIGFRNQSYEKSVVMMHIFGMRKKDLTVKALLDAALFSFLPSCVGFGCGYPLFLHFSGKILWPEALLPGAPLQSVALLSAQSMVVFCETFGLVAFLIFFGNLYIDFRMAEKPMAQALYRRKGKGGRHDSLYILAAEVVGILSYAVLAFHVKRNSLWAVGIVAVFLSTVLFSIFHLFFGIFAKKSRKARKVNRAKDLSFCFLCSRNKRDALLCVLISIGTIFCCLAANIGFNISGMLRSAYQDNMGFTVLVRVDDDGQEEQIKDCLDGNGFTYTFGYSKLMDYSQLKGMDGEEGKFWALVIDSQTDGNPHFSVPEGNFRTEEYFAARCGVANGEASELFGSRVRSLGMLEDSQYLSLVNYSFLVNKSDWKLGIDNSWSPIFLLDVSLEEERAAGRILTGMSCHMESASGLIDEIKRMMSDYLEILLLVTGMVALVTAAVFYTVIRSDLSDRRTEVYLYRIFGASFARAQRVIFYEYILIALISSLAVSFTIMVCGEFYFYFGLKKHFPLSLPITAGATALAAAFIFLCCQAAGYANARNVGTGTIRDE